MPISDWSSDVCSSDLEEEQRLHAKQDGDHRLPIIGRGERRAEDLNRGEQRVEQQQQRERLPDSERVDRVGLHTRARDSPAIEELGRESCRDRVRPSVTCSVVTEDLKTKHKNIQ